MRQLDGSRDAATAPVLDSLRATGSLVKSKRRSQLRRAAEAVDELGVFVHAAF